MNNGTTQQALTINDLLSPEVTSLSDDDLLNVYGGSGGASDCWAGYAAGVTAGVGVASVAPVPFVAAVGLGFAGGMFALGAISCGFGY